jgi:hypothetical protein
LSSRLGEAFDCLRRGSVMLAWEGGGGIVFGRCGCGKSADSLRLEFWCYGDSRQCACYLILTDNEPEEQGCEGHGQGAGRAGGKDRHHDACGCRGAGPS